MFLSNVLYAADLQRYVLIVSIANLVLNCGVNFALIPIWSYYGAAVATTVTECLNSVLQYAAVLFLFKLFRYEKRIAFVLIRAWLWIFCLGILLLVFPNGTTLSLSILLTGIYLLQLTLSKDVSVQDIRRLFRQPVPSETS
jgi:O-antigen/teichoic acid export membrane protein